MRNAFQAATIRELSYLVLALEHKIFVSYQDQQVIKTYTAHWVKKKTRVGLGIRYGREEALEKLLNY